MSLESSRSTFSKLNGKYQASPEYGKNDEINIKTKNPEFIDWKWIEPKKLPEVIVNFKKNIFNKIYGLI